MVAAFYAGELRIFLAVLVAIGHIYLFREVRLAESKTRSMNMNKSILLFCEIA